MISDTAIHIEDLGKKYEIPAFPDKSKPPKGLFKNKYPTESFWALKNFNATISRGEVVGIIGKNGAGKSTLLKILSRITYPTTGKATIRGKIGSLLEVGTGFHPELTGRENVYLNGAILGMSRAEINSKFDEIVDFSGVEEFLDVPIKRYSSGMKVRLGFAVAAHLNPSVLIVDEVLSVGDYQFQKKSLKKIRDVSSEGRTTLFVSHNTTAVKNLCSRAILLKNGEIAADGTPDEVVNSYLAEYSDSVLRRVWDYENAPGNETARLLEAKIRSSKGERPEDMFIDSEMRLQFRARIDRPCMFNFSWHLMHESGVDVFNSIQEPRRYEKGEITAHCVIPADFLNAGGYYVNLFLVKDSKNIICKEEGVLSFRALEGKREALWHGRWEGVVRPKLNWSVESSGD